MGGQVEFKVVLHLFQNKSAQHGKEVKGEWHPCLICGPTCAVLPAGA